LPTPDTSSNRSIATVLNTNNITGSAMTLLRNSNDTIESVVSQLCIAIALAVFSIKKNNDKIDKPINKLSG